MMYEEELVREINRLRREKDAIILAHNYQTSEIQQIADYVGDSLDLARRAMKVRQHTIVFCGVVFMAESAKVLSPDKTVLIPDPKAVCALANKISLEEIRTLKLHHPEAAVIGYINTHADVKGECDSCCTSANAVEIVKALPAGDVIFLPDINLGYYVERMTGRKLIKWPGYCYVHYRMIRRPLVQALKLQHPKAVILAHPECPPEVLSLADLVTGTNGMVRFVAESNESEFIILTELGLVERLRREFPGKTFFHVPDAVCDTMKLNNLQKLYECLRDGKYVIEVPEEVAHGARRALEKMTERTP